VGYSCLAEIRTVETLTNGEPRTPFLKAGDNVRIWMDDDQGRAIFGTIEQTVAAPS
jgi:fumarylacetoacetate (FAA) hydrolase